MWQIETRQIFRFNELEPLVKNFRKNCPKKKNLITNLPKQYLQSFFPSEELMLTGFWEKNFGLF